MRRNQQAGYSMVELLAVLAAATVILAVTLPGLRQALASYHRSGAAREVLAQVREAQSAAITRGGVYGLQWGGDTGVNYPPSQYRIVKDTSGGCVFPAVGAAEDATTVLTGWTDLAATNPGTKILSVLDNNGTAVGKVLFKSSGASVNTCTSVSFPITITVSDRTAGTRQIVIRSAGSIRLL